MCKDDRSYQRMIQCIKCGRHHAAEFCGQAGEFDRYECTHCGEVFLHPRHDLAMQWARDSLLMGGAKKEGNGDG